PEVEVLRAAEVIDNSCVEISYYDALGAAQSLAASGLLVSRGKEAGTFANGIEAAATVAAEHRDKSSNHEEYTKAQDIYLAIRALKSKPSPQVGRGEPQEVKLEPGWLRRDVDSATSP